MKRCLRVLITPVVASVAAVLLMGPALAFELKKEVDVVVPSSAGGGSDLNARTIADIIKTEKFADANFMVTNKPGGSGAVALSYAFNKSGDDHTLVTIAIGQIISS